MAVAFVLIEQKFDMVSFSACLKCSSIESQIILIGAGILLVESNKQVTQSAQVLKYVGRSNSKVS